MHDRFAEPDGPMGRSDYIARGTALDRRVRAFAIHATGVVSELQRRHAAFPAVSAALGRTAMATLLLASSALKREEHLLTMEVKGNGPAGRILCTADGRGRIRGTVSRPQVDSKSVVPGKLNVAGVVGTSGYLSVVRDSGGRDAYRGMVELQTGEIGEDVAYYLLQSEQTPSAVGLGVFVQPDGSVSAAGGFLLQLLPGLGDDEIVEIERRVAALPHPTRLLRDGVSAEGILRRLFGDEIEIGANEPVTFHCPCTRERFEAAIVSLGEREITELVAAERGDPTEVVCHFCNERYEFTPREMREILERARAA
jgi:molecular chaperone Hsp33